MQSPEFFSVFPRSAFAQAFVVTRGEYLLNDNKVWMLVFLRHTLVPAPDGCARNANGKTAGVEVVAYTCDEYGRVFDWEKRFETTGVGLEAALDRLRFELANAVAYLSNYEGCIEVSEEVDRDSWRFDWAQMPEQLQ